MSNDIGGTAAAAAVIISVAATAAVGTYAVNAIDDAIRNKHNKHKENSTDMVFKCSKNQISDAFDKAIKENAGKDGHLEFKSKRGICHIKFAPEVG